MTKAIVFSLALLFVVGGGAEANDRGPGWRQEQCRFKTVGTRAWSASDVEATIRCVAAREDVSADEALSVWRCESGWAYEPAHSDCCHGPMQYMRDTFRAQFGQLKQAIRRRYGEVAERVHNVRANITTAVVFIGHGGSWSPTWACG